MYQRRDGTVSDGATVYIPVELRNFARREGISMSRVLKETLQKMKDEQGG